jgi:hypothetical protein
MCLMRRFLTVLVLALALPALVQAASNPVVSAAKRTAAAKTVTFRIAAITTVAGGRATMTGSGVQRGSEARLSLRVGGQGGAAVRMDAVLLEEDGSYVVYMRSPLFASQLPRGKSWIRIDLSKQTASLGVDFSSLVSTSQTFAPLEKGLVSTTRKGQAVVAGRSTTRYRAIIDVKRAARLVPAYGKQVAAIRRATGVTLGRVPYDVWVAGDGRIRQVRYATPTVQNGKTVQTMTFLAFNERVTIEAPPRSQVVSP